MPARDEAIAEQVASMGDNELVTARRQLGASAGLLKPDSPMAGPAGRYLAVLDAELARRYITLTEYEVQPGQLP